MCSDDTVAIEEKTNGESRMQIGKDAKGDSTFLYAAPKNSVPVRVSDGKTEVTNLQDGIVRPWGINRKNEERKT